MDKFVVVNESNNSEVAHFTSLEEANTFVLNNFKENKKSSLVVKDKDNKVVFRAGVLLG